MAAVMHGTRLGKLTFLQPISSENGAGRIRQACRLLARNHGCRGRGERVVTREWPAFRDNGMVTLRWDFSGDRTTRGFAWNRFYLQGGALKIGQRFADCIGTRIRESRLSSVGSAIFDEPNLVSAAGLVLVIGQQVEVELVCTLW